LVISIDSVLGANINTITKIKFCYINSFHEISFKFHGMSLYNLPFHQIYAVPTVQRHCIKDVKWIIRLHGDEVNGTESHHGKGKLKGDKKKKKVEEWRTDGVEIHFQ